MPILTLTVQDIEILKKAESKIYYGKRLSLKEKAVLKNFLQSLPTATELLNERFPLDEKFDIKVFDFKEMMPHIEKWITLFNNLPKNGSTRFPEAGWFDPEEDDTFWKRNVIVEASFIPSVVHSKKRNSEPIGLNLKTDGTAFFEFYLAEDIKNHPDLYKFKGSWKEAYLLVVKTLQQGWPQTKFPKEFEQFL